MDDSISHLSSLKSTSTIKIITMKSFACVVLLAAVALAAPEGQRDKRGFLHGGYELGHGFGHGYGHSFGHSSLDFGHGHIDYHAPAKIVSVHKVVEVPKVVEVKKIVSVPKVVSVPEIVKVSKIIEPHYHSHYSSSDWY